MKRLSLLRYLEGPGGPIRLGDLEWVEVSTKRLKGGIAGRPRELVDITDSLLVALRTTGLRWELREASWVAHGVFDEEAVQVVRVVASVG